MFEGKTGKCNTVNYSLNHNIGTYAVKIFSLLDQKKSFLLASSSQEIKVLQRVKHKHIVELLGVKTTDTEVCLFMELFDKNLASVIATKNDTLLNNGSAWFSVQEVK